MGLLALLLCAGGGLAQPAHKIELTDRQKVRATVTYEIATTRFAASKWMVFLPEPPELPSQHGVKTTADPAGRLVEDKSPLARPVRYIERRVVQPIPGGGLGMKFTVEATLRSRKLVPLGPNENPPRIDDLTADERTYYLSATTRVDHDARAVRNWLDDKKLRLGKGESPLDLAARTVDAIRTSYRYHYDPNEDKRASVTCKADRTDCGGMTYLFVAAMRANGVPARALVGRFALPRRPGSTPRQTGYDRPHIRAEFFAPGVGWVPVDVNTAHSARNQKATEFVGADPGDMLVLHVDVDLKLPFPDKVREAQLLQIEPFYWTEGTGTFDGRFAPSGWELTATPVARP